MPSTSISASPPEICLGESVIFTGVGADAYLWPDGIIDGSPYFPTETGDLPFAVTGTDDETGCSSTASISITVYDSPLISVSASELEICEG